MSIIHDGLLKLIRLYWSTALPINGAAAVSDGAYSHTPASHVVTTTTAPLNAYDDDETEDEDMVGGTIYDSPKRESAAEKHAPIDHSDAPASPSPNPPAKHEFDARTASASDRIASDDESAGETDAAGEVEQHERPTDDEEDDDDNDANQPEYQESADEGDYEDEDDEMDLEEMDDDEDEDFDMSGKKSKRKGKGSKKGSNGYERAGKRGREDSSSSKCKWLAIVFNGVPRRMTLHRSASPKPIRIQNHVTERIVG